MNVNIHRIHSVRRSGFTLVEMLLSVVLSLMVMYGVAQIFSVVGNSVNDSRALLGLGDRLRATSALLAQDLDGVTANMTPPCKSEDNRGYFELIEGPVGVTVDVWDRAKNTNEPSIPEDDTTPIDYDDILMFTTRTTTNEPFVGRAVTAPSGTIESRFAEVAWFLRGRTLYRRLKIIKPESLMVDFTSLGTPFEKDYDLSARLEGDPTNTTTWKWIPNSLSDLTKRENRMYHVLPVLPVDPAAKQALFPFSIHGIQAWQVLGLPTLGESSSGQWMADQASLALPTTVTLKPGWASGQLDFWNEPYPYDELDHITGNLTAYKGPRTGEDVVMHNVIGFDVKVWDPEAPVLSYSSQVLQPGDPGYNTALATVGGGAGSATVVGQGAFVDLGSGVAGAITKFTGLPEPKSGLAATSTPPIPISSFIYDTWSTHYEHGGPGHNGLDDNSNGVVDDPAELLRSPPYPVRLEAIQVKIRVFDPDSRQVREVTTVHRFSKN